MNKEKILELITDSSERDLLKVEELATEYNVSFDIATRLVIKNWFDYQEEKQLENKSNNLDFKESKERLIYLEKMVDKILDKLESDRK